MTGLLRHLERQPLRTGLTVAGVALGMLTLVALGALGEHFRAVLVEARGYTAGSVRLFTKTNAEGVNSGISPEQLDRVRALPGVRLVTPTLLILLDGFDLEADPLSFATPKPMVEGLEAPLAGEVRAGLPLVEGRWLEAGDERAAVVARWLARRRGLAVGGEVTIRHRPYRVVGLYEAPDLPMLPAAVVPYAALDADFTRPQRERARADLARLAREVGLGARPGFAPGPVLDRVADRLVEAQEALFRVYEVVPADRSAAGTRALAAAMREAVPDLAVIDPERIDAQVGQAMGMFLVVSLVVTALSTVVGGLLVVNTMAMAVLERRREIAVKAAVGAVPLQVALELTAEAALLGLVGAVLGVALGAAAIALAEPLLLERTGGGFRLFLLTPRLVLGTVAYGALLGAVAGFVPALRAARVDPAVALREL